MRVHERRGSLFTLAPENSVQGALAALGFGLLRWLRLAHVEQGRAA